MTEKQVSPEEEQRIHDNNFEKMPIGKFVYFRKILAGLTEGKSLKDIAADIAANSTGFDQKQSDSLMEAIMTIVRNVPNKK